MPVRPFKFLLCLSALLSAQRDAHADEVLRFKVLVTLKSRSTEAPKPFPDVGGFTIKRLAADMPGAKCPDASDNNGQLECSILCSANDPNPRLTIVTPSKERQRIIAGYGIEPNSASIQLAACKFVGEPKIVFLYKSLDVLLAELKQSSPNVYAAVVARTPGGQEGAVIKFADSAPVLSALAQSADNRAGLILLSKLADIRRESLPPPEKEGDALSAYGVGARSALFRAAVVQTNWPDADKMAAVTHDQVEFSQSVSKVAKELNKRPTLKATEIRLDQEVRGMGLRK